MPSPGSSNLKSALLQMANGWDVAKMLLQVLTLLKGHAWAVFDPLTEANTDSYDHLKTTLLVKLAPDSSEEKMSKLSHR